MDTTNGADWPHWLRLALTPGIGNVLARKLLAAFGSVQTLFDQSKEALGTVVGPLRVGGLLQAPPDWAAQVQLTQTWLNALEPDGVARRLVTLGDPMYPVSLLEMDDPPLLLYALVGPRWACHTAQWLGQALCSQSLAVVGSRNPTPQGVLNARAFARDLAASGWCVVSGMALGVDGAAHEGALEGAPQDSDHIPTIAVVGTGLDRVYPRQHHALARTIAQRGVVLSEYALGTPATSANFPRRNRLIAGLSRGTLVVEAAVQSGSLITARLALEQGKDVFAIPGSIHSTQSHGCHALIKQGAKLVETCADILDELPDANRPLALEVTEMRVSDTDHPVLGIMGFDPVSFESIQIRTGAAAAHLQVQLFELEMDGHIARLPGGLLQRVGAA